MLTLEEAVIRGLRAAAVSSWLDASADLEGDSLLLDELLSGGIPDGFLRLWEGTKLLVTSRRLARSPDFDAAALSSAAAGWPVEVRASGGSTVVHRPGVLNISLFLLDRGDRDPMSAAYASLTGLMSSTLVDLGIETYHGPVAQGYCDGAFNLCWAGRKLAGTAAIVRSRASKVGRLVHASLSVDGDVSEDVRAVQRFERSLGLAAEYSEAAHTSVAGAFMQSRRALHAGIPAECIRTAA